LNTKISTRPRLSGLFSTTTYLLDHDLHPDADHIDQTLFYPIAPLILDIHPIRRRILGDGALLETVHVVVQGDDERQVFRLDRRVGLLFLGGRGFGEWEGDEDGLEV
jgi:hypothetical protein